MKYLLGWLVLASSLLQAVAFDTDWQISPPKQEGMSAAGLDRLREGLIAHSTHALLVIRNDKIVCEWYAPNSGTNVPHYIASMSKAVVAGVSAAVAINDGLITIDDRAAKYVPQWREGPKSQIILRQLGSHTSGLADAESNSLPHAELTGWQGDFWKQPPPPRDPFTLSRDATPVIYPPGEKLQYSNPGIAMLTYCVTASLRNGPQKDIRSLLRDRVMRTIGVPDNEWSVGYNKTIPVDGLPLVGSWGGGAYTARALGRVGRLMLHEGDWNGRRLLSAESVRAVTRDAGTPGSGAIGWWSNNDGEHPKLPRDAYWGAGAGHQILLVIPSKNIVAIRMGALLAKVSSNTPSDYHVPVRDLFFDPLVAAIAK